MERKRTLTMTWDGLADVDDDDDRYFETFERISTAVPLDLASSDDDEEDFEDSRVSFASAVSSATHLHNHTTKKEFQNFASSAPGSMSPDYDVWMLAPGSITERRKRLFQDMGLSRDRELLSFKVGGNHINNSNNTNTHHQAPANVSNNNNNNSVKVSEEIKQHNSNLNSITQTHSESPAKRENSPTQENSPETTVVLVRSRSDGDIESLCVDKKRKEEMIGLISKQRLTRTSSTMLLQHAKICPYQESVRVASKDSSGNSVRSVRRSGNFASILSSGRLGAFFLIKNLDTGKEFIVNEYNENGMWNKLSDLQTGKQLTMEEFEKSVGHSPVVKELMRRENVNCINDTVRKFSANSYLSKSLRMSKRRGAALLKNIKGVAHSMSSKGDKESNNPNPLLGDQREQKEQKQNKNVSNQWVKVRQSGKSYKELSALHLCQEIQAHEGCIWTIKFSLDARFLASAGEDRVIHVWEVQECEVMSMQEGNLTPIHPPLCNSSDKASSLDGSSPNLPPEKKKKGKHSSPDYVHVPETVFSLSDKPFCSFKGHLDDVLDLSWSRSHLLLSSSMDKTVRLWDMETKSCLKLFAHNDYVTCIQFNPMDDDYFISGSLDAKVRIWSISDRLVVDWTDLHEMVTAACYTPDGQNALIGSHKGSCRLYSVEDGKLHQLNQVDFQTKKKSSTKKITGFQFSPSNPSEVLVTSADSRIRILDCLDIVHKFRGFRNTSSQISAAFNADGKYIVSASEDSQVYVWKREEHRNASTGKRSTITTRNHEHFQCKDVSVAIPWPGMVKGEPPPMPVQTKKHSKRISSNPTSATSSPTKEESSAGHSRRLLPPLPKKTNKVERVQSPPEEELALFSRDPGISESFTSNSSSIRSGDSPSISTASESNSNSYSLRQDDPASISSSTDKNSSSFTNWSSWFDVGNHSSHTVQATAWGLVIVTATLGGEIKTYQNFGIPRRLGRL